MKIGDLVQFSDHQDRYAKWFYSHMGEVISVTNGHCRVKWLQPVLYYNNMTAISDFAVERFEVVG